jgi:hypothetical protein
MDVVAGGLTASCENPYRGATVDRNGAVYIIHPPPMPARWRTALKVRQVRILAFKFDLPVASFPAHWAPKAVVFYEARQFLAKYLGDGSSPLTPPGICAGRTSGRSGSLAL